MLGKDVIERLSRLRRAQIGDMTRAAEANHAQHTADTAQPAELAGQEYETSWGPCWRIDAPLNQLLPVIDAEIERVQPCLPALAARSDMHRDHVALATAFPQQLMLLDLETCGFAGSPIFLAGLVHFENGRLQLTQLLARDYSEEKSMLQALWQCTARKHVLVTFNGKSFDWPSVHDRSTRHHLGRDDRDQGPRLQTVSVPEPVPNAMTRRDPRPQLHHVDLLHHSRRIWGASLPNCRLQTLEQYLCRRRRVADIPGHAIPAAYDDFVRTRDARWMNVILHHNALDLITLLQLVLRMSFHVSQQPVNAGHALSTAIHDTRARIAAADQPRRAARTAG